MARWKLIAGIFLGILALPIIIGGLAITVVLPFIQDNEGYYMSPNTRVNENDGVGFIVNVNIEDWLNDDDGDQPFQLS